MKYYVIDTNVWLLDPSFYERYRDGVLVIPSAVLRELDKHKSSFGVLGINARLGARLISKVAEGLKTATTNYVSLPEGNFLIALPPKHGHESLDLTVNDDAIIATALACKDYELDDDITVVSNDVNVRSKTLALWKLFGIDAVEYSNEGAFKISNFYKINEFEVSEKIVADLFQGGLKTKNLCSDLTPNTPFILVQNEERILAKVSACGSHVLHVDPKKIKGSFKELRDFKPKNDGQVLLVDAIKNNGSKILAVCGRTGSGKSMTVLATALDLLKQGKYEKIRLFKPVQAMGAEIGFLSGDYYEKTAPIRATFESTFAELGVDLHQFEEQKRIEFDVPVYMRGFTFRDTIIIIDEAQLMEPGVLKGLITRAHESSMVICLGDTRQATDNRFLNENYNGLSNLIHKLGGQEFFTTIYLDKSERSDHLNIVDELL